MTIPAASQIPSLLQPAQRNPFVDNASLLTSNGWQVLQGLFGFINGMCRTIPCNATGTNVITLTMLQVSPLVQGYYDYDAYRAVAANTSTGTVTALVATPQGNLATLKVYKSNGASQASTGDVVAGLLYDFVYVDSLDSGNGGFILK